MDIDLYTLMFLGGIAFVWIVLIFSILRRRGKIYIQVVPESGKMYGKWKKVEHGNVIMEGPLRGKKLPVWQFGVKRGCFLRIRKALQWTDTVMVTEDAGEAIDFTNPHIEVPVWDQKTFAKVAAARALEHAGEGDKPEKTGLIIFSILLGVLTLALLGFMAYRLGIL